MAPRAVARGQNLATRMVSNSVSVLHIQTAYLYFTDSSPFVSSFLKALFSGLRFKPAQDAAPPRAQASAPCLFFSY